MDDIGPKDDGWILTQFTNECLDPYDDTSVVGKDRCAVPYRYLSRLCEMASQGAAARREGVIETLERVVEHLESKPGVYCFDAAQEFRAEIERLKGV